jgi:methionyl-tRNA synthetase
VFPSLSSSQGQLLLVLIIWSLVWKGIAMWKAARNDQLNWFLAIFILSSAGVLEIVYLLFFQKKQQA